MSLEALLFLIFVIIAIVIALLLACALRIVCRGTAASSSRAVADDPFFYPIGEAPTLPLDWQRERAIGNYRRHLDASDFRAWGVPSISIRERASADILQFRRSR